MTSQEQQMIDGLIQRVNATNVTDKDPEAEQYLQRGFAGNGNALYILAQTVLVQQYALDQAQKQLADLRQQQQQPAQKHGGFLSSIFGSGDSEPQRSAPPPPPQQQGYQPVPSQGYAPQQAQYAQPGYAAPATGGGQGGFLRGAAQTAAGVAAGALAFQGVESLLHGFGNSMVGGERGFDGGAPREEVINNYYGDSDRDDRNFADDRDSGNADRDSNDNDPGSNMFTDADSSSDQGGFDDSGSDFDSGGMDDGSADMGSDDSSF